MRYFVTLGGNEIPVDVTLLPSGAWSVSVDGRLLDVDATPVGRALSLRIDGCVVDLVLDGALPNVALTASGRRSVARVESERARIEGSARKATTAGAESMVISPMPGRVIRVLVEQGQEVEEGAPLLVVEAMKMENELYARQRGRIATVFVRAGDTVDGGAKLIAMAP